jgi:hypothetical protein
LGPARSYQLGTIARKAIGPRSARTGDGGIAAWIASAERGGGAELRVVPFDADGAPLRAPLAAASVPLEATSLVLQPTARGRGGWWAVWTAIEDRGESVTFLELAQEGTPRGTPFVLQRTADHVVWADLLPTTSGALCVWAEQSGTGDANILAASIDVDGRPRGLPVRVARGIERWAAAPSGDGAALALVTRTSSSAAGLLSWVRLDPAGNPSAAPVPIAKETTVSSDVDLVSSEEGWLLAWTDRSGEDAQVTLAAVDATGRVRGPARPLKGTGGSSLVSIASGPAGVALAWEVPHSQARPNRTMLLALVSTAGELAARAGASFEVVGSAPAELVATHDGFALLATPSPRCDDRDGDCSQQGVPMFLRYDKGLGFTQGEPLLLGEAHAPATFAWGLRCADEHCVALASTGSLPTPVFTVDLPRRASLVEAPPPPPSPPPGAPRGTATVTLASGKPYIDLAASSTAEGMLVATMAEASESAGKRTGAVIAVRAFDETGHPVEGETTLTRRAAPVGRVAMASMPTSEGGAAAAWAAGDGARAHVYIARLDSRGRSLKRVQLTESNSDASSVAIAWANDGWLVAWVDTRDGNGEVYATKVDRNLKRAAPERRITNAAGDAADVSLSTDGETAWLAWSDPRESPKEGVGDVFVTTLSTRDGKRKGDEVRVLATAAHSRSPVLVALDGGGAFLAWIEDAPPGIDARAMAMFARLDNSGHTVGAPATLRMAGPGRPTTVALASSPEGVQAVIARSTDAGITLDALGFSRGGQQATSWPIAELDAPAAFDVVLALAGSALFYDDVGTTATDHRVRRLGISW